MGCARITPIVLYHQFVARHEMIAYLALRRAAWVEAHRASAPHTATIHTAAAAAGRHCIRSRRPGRVAGSVTLRQSCAQRSHPMQRARRLTHPGGGLLASRLLSSGTARCELGGGTSG